MFTVIISCSVMRSCVQVFFEVGFCFLPLNEHVLDKDNNTFFKGRIKKLRYITNLAVSKHK